MARQTGKESKLPPLFQQCDHWIPHWPLKGIVPGTSFLADGDDVTPMLESLFLACWHHAETVFIAKNIASRQANFHMYIQN